MYNLEHSLINSISYDVLAIISNNELVASGRISLKGDIAYIGIGLKPSFCGKSYGKDIMNLLIEECKKRFDVSI